MNALREKFADAPDLVLANIQTVWESPKKNSRKSLAKTIKKHEIQIPTGFDLRIDGEGASHFSSSYGTYGTPWLIIIDRNGVVRYSEGPTKEIDDLAGRLQTLLDEPKPEIPEEK